MSDSRPGCDRAAWIICALTSISLTASVMAQADQLPRTPSFTEAVVDIKKYGLIEFAFAGTFRLWGVIADADQIREAVLGEEISCNYAGASYMHPELPLKTVICDAASPKRPNMGDLGRYLISEKGARELCAETSNYYGTCD
jgi:hypothetical protein